MNKLTIEEARKIMGDDPPDIDDRELETVIGYLEMLASETISSIVEGEMKLPKKDSDD